MEPYRRNLEPLHTIHAWRFSRASVGPWHGRISTWRLSGYAAEASVERNESFGVSTHNRWQHETWSGDCTDPSPEARALGCLRRFSFLRPLCASQGSLLFQTSAYSSASPGAACPKCPPLRTDPPSGEGVVGFSARFSNLDLISHLSDTDRCELLVQIPSMPLVHPCGDATGFRQCLWCTPLDIRECLWCTLWTRDGHCFLPRRPPPPPHSPPTHPPPYHAHGQRGGVHI